MSVREAGNVEITFSLPVRKLRPGISASGIISGRLRRSPGGPWEGEYCLEKTYLAYGVYRCSYLGSAREISAGVADNLWSRAFISLAGTRKLADV